MKRVVTFLIIIVILAGGAYAFMQWRAQQQVNELSNLQTTPAERGELVASIGATGEVHSKQTALLTWKTSGTVESIAVKIGDKVQIGDKLATLQQRSLPQNVIMAQADLVSAQKAREDLYKNAEDAKIAAIQAIAQYAQAVKGAQYQLDNYIPPTELANLGTMEALDVMEKRLDEARQAFEPYKYFSSGNATRQDLKEALDEAQSDYNAAVKRLEYEYQLQVARANLEKARQDYEKWSNGPDAADLAAIDARIAASEATLNQAWIEAPISGTITVAEPQPGDQVTPNLQAFRIDDLSELLVDVAVSEVDINQIKVGQDVLLTFDAILGKEYTGTVTEVAQVGNAVQGVVDFVATVKLIDADEDVKSGMTAAVNVITDKLEDVLLVPNRAVRVKEGKRVVYILKDGQLSAINVTLGASSGLMSEVIESELQAGDLIVLNPPQEFDSNGPPPFARR